MNLTYIEDITRHYTNGVHIQFEIINNNDIYIMSIRSDLKQKGYGTETLNAFLKEFNDKNIYLFATSENGTALKVLKKWYKSLGFSKCSNLSYIPFNVSHCKKKQ